MPDKNSQELDCSGLTDFSEAGIVRWMDENAVFEPADESPLKQGPIVDPCLADDESCALDELQRRGCCPPGMASD